MALPARNDPCPCGSGRKFKKCCMETRQAAEDQIRRAAQHIQAGRLEEAERLLGAVLAADPQQADALHLSGHVADRRGHFDLALERLERAIELAPDNAVYHNSLGIAFGQRLRPEEAIAAFRRALAVDPGYQPALANLATVLYGAGQFDEAEDCFRRLLHLGSRSADIHTNLGNLLQAQGRLDEARALYDRALQLDPPNAGAHAARVFNCLYEPRSAPGDALACARRFADEQEKALAVHRRAHDNAADPDRRLRIGYVSADFRCHSVAYFIEPILACHDRARFEVYCYATGPVRDAVTERLEASADHWVVARGLRDADLAQRIRADRIDILVDLSGHSAGNRLLVFARKPAPLQFTWIGFLATTGLRSIDYRLTDGIADPADQAEDLHSERLIRLPRSCLCYRPPLEAPGVAPLPALTSGCMTFGSFNTPAKHNARVLELWAGILQAVPQSRLLLKGRGLERGRLRSMTLGVFTSHGIAAERILLQPYENDQTEYLRRYDAVDIGLDPFPHNGVTTTCAALWMGVPVVALRGDRHCARMCASVLTNAGLAEMVADHPEEYRQVAVALAADPRRLAQLRSDLRDRLRASALMDEAGVTREVEAALRSAWRDWCLGCCMTASPTGTSVIRHKTPCHTAVPQ
jgi:protein O-GlcNAc transferase